MSAWIPGAAGRAIRGTPVRLRFKKGEGNGGLRTRCGTVKGPDQDRCQPGRISIGQNALGGQRLATLEMLSLNAAATRRTRDSALTLGGELERCSAGTSWGKTGSLCMRAGTWSYISECLCGGK